MATKRVATTASTNSTLAQAGPTRLTSIVVSNTSAAAKYLKLYDKATAPVVGTDVPVLTLAIPPNGGVLALQRYVKGFALGLGFGITGAVGDTDTTVTAANDVVGEIGYS